MCLEDLRNATKSRSEDSLSQCSDFKPGPSEYEAGMLTTQPRLSVDAAAYQAWTKHSSWETPFKRNIRHRKRSADWNEAFKAVMMDSV
jgi:hypothetical protein